MKSSATAENDMDNYDVLMKLIGPVKPVGETNADNARFENLKELTALTDRLLSDISDIAYFNEGSGQYSVKRAGEHCRTFLNRLGVTP